MVNRPFPLRGHGVEALPDTDPTVAAALRFRAEAALFKIHSKPFDMTIR